MENRETHRNDTKASHHCFWAATFVGFSIFLFFLLRIGRNCNVSTHFHGEGYSSYRRWASVYLKKKKERILLKMDVLWRTKQLFTLCYCSRLTSSFRKLSWPCEKLFCPKHEFRGCVVAAFESRAVGWPLFYFSLTLHNCFTSSNLCTKPVKQTVGWLYRNKKRKEILEIRLSTLNSTAFLPGRHCVLNGSAWYYLVLYLSSQTGSNGPVYYKQKECWTICLRLLQPFPSSDWNSNCLPPICLSIRLRPKLMMT